MAGAEAETGVCATDAGAGAGVAGAEAETGVCATDAGAGVAGAGVAGAGAEAGACATDTGAGAGVRVRAETELCDGRRSGRGGRRRGGCGRRSRSLCDGRRRGGRFLCDVRSRRLIAGRPEEHATDSPAKNLFATVNLFVLKAGALYGQSNALSGKATRGHC